MAQNYRSYVVRIRTHRELPRAIRVDVEDLQSGTRAQVTGDVGAQFATELTRIVGGDAPPELDNPAEPAGQG